ncbi:nucleobase:cation symporter-1, NCS1 family [Marmoricola sp. URHA0025 HA25]
MTANHAAGTGPVETDTAGHIESHGIDMIPDEERHGRPWELFPVWFGGNVIFTYLLFGGILVELQLPLATSLVLAVIFNAAWGLVGLVATVGPKTGTATMVVSRAQYGMHGNKLSCLFNWIVQVGYEGVNFAIAAFGVFALVSEVGWHVGTPAKALIILAIAGVSFVLGLYGHATIIAVQKVLTWTLGIATVVFAIFLIPHVDWSYEPAQTLHGSAMTAAVLIGISVVLSGPLSYPIAADYARYLPRDTSSRAVALYTAAGGYIPAVCLMAIGILAGTVVDPTNFTESIRGVVPGWFYPIYLLIVILGLMSNSIYSIYSSGLVLQAMGIPLKRTRTVWIDAIVGTAIALYGVLIAAHFLEALQNFLLWSIYWLAPFFGIYLVELIVRKGRYNARALHERSGPYWYSGGIRWGGVVALLIGMVGSAMLSNTPYFVGPLSDGLLNGGDLSAVGGLVIGAVAYWALCVLPQRNSPSAVRSDAPARSTSELA